MIMCFELELTMACSEETLVSIEQFIAALSYRFIVTIGIRLTIWLSYILRYLVGEGEKGRISVVPEIQI